MAGGERITVLGQITYLGQDIMGLKPSLRARQGIVLCPERRRIFPESTVLENIDDTIIKMRELKLLGVSFSMDDFGTGYSSLQYLKLLPLDQIKIDRSFVRDITFDPNDDAIVQTIIAMSKALGLNVIAEGVETETQRDFLDRHGCPAFQGYLFGKPLPTAQFEDLLHAQTYNSSPDEAGINFDI